MIWILGGLGLLGIYLLTRRSLAKNLVFNLSDVKFLGSVLKPIIKISFSVQNPSNQTATLKGVAGTLIFNGNPISNVSNFEQQTINARSESTITIDVKPSILGIASTIIDAIKGKRITGTITFNGSANVDGVLIPIKQDYAL